MMRAELVFMKDAFMANFKDLSIKIAVCVIGIKCLIVNRITVLLCICLIRQCSPWC